MKFKNFKDMYKEMEKEINKPIPKNRIVSQDYDLWLNEQYSKKKAEAEILIMEYYIKVITREETYNQNRLRVSFQRDINECNISEFSSYETAECEVVYG